MLSSYLRVLSLLLLLAISGCCLSVDCDYGSGPIQLRLVRDGKNALYGPDAFLTKDDLKHMKMVGTDLVEDYIAFNDSLQTIELYVFLETPSLLQIENITTDTISITTDLHSKKGCCDEYLITSVLNNGNIICEGLCQEAIALEL